MAASVATDQDRQAQLAEANARLGIIWVLVAEGMFFVGMVSVAFKLRSLAVSWPPPDAPALDMRVLLFNTAILVLSAVAAGLAWRDVRGGNGRGAARLLAATFALGVTFLAGQVLEFSHLGGWRPQDSMFRTLFDTLCGLHAAHVVVGLALLALVGLLTWRGRLAETHRMWVLATVAYWFFVTAAWLVLLPVLTVP